MPGHKHRVRASGQLLAQVLTDAGIGLDEVPPASDGWHDHASLSAAIVAGLTRPRPPVSAGPTMTPREAFESGRITARSTPDWEARFATDPVGVGRTLAGLAPVLSDGVRAAAGSAEPVSLLDEVDDQVFGPFRNDAARERLYAAQDAAAETEYSAMLAAERAAAAESLSDDEYRSIFGEPGD